MVSVGEVARPLASRCHRHELETKDTLKPHGHQHQDEHSETPALDLKKQAPEIELDPHKQPLDPNNRYVFGDGYVTPPQSPRGDKEDYEQLPGNGIDQMQDDNTHPPKKLETEKQASVGQTFCLKQSVVQKGRWSN